VWIISNALMNSLSSLAQAGESSEDICSDGAPSAPLSESHTPQAFLCSDRTTAYSRLSRFGMTFALLTADRGEELLMSYLEGFPVRTSAQQDEELASMAHVLDSGWRWHGSFVKYDPDTCSWRTPQCSLLEDSDEFSQTWPRWGLMRDGECLEQSTPALRIEETEFGLWQTPVADDAANRMNGKWNSRGEPKLSAQVMWPTPTVCGNYNRKGASATSGDGLATAVRMWPTPMARDWKDSAKSGNRKSPNLGAEVHWPTPRTKGMCGGSGAWQQLKEATTIEEARMMGAGNGGQLNPTWVEWLMGWPLEWTDLRPLATDKFRQWQHSHGASSEVHDAD